MNLFTRNSPYYHLIKYLLFLLKHPIYKHTQTHTYMQDTEPLYRYAGDTEPLLSIREKAVARYLWSRLLYVHSAVCLRHITALL